MLEYVLFHQKPFELFVEYLKANKLQPETGENNGVFEIKIPEDTEAALSDQIETYYDELMDMNRELFFAENARSEENFSVASVVIKLKNGETTNAHVSPDLLYRVIEAIGSEGLDELVTAIADAVENPDMRCFGQKVREGEVTFEPAEKVILNQR